MKTGLVEIRCTVNVIGNTIAEAVERLQKQIDILREESAKDTIPTEYAHRNHFYDGDVHFVASNKRTNNEHGEGVSSSMIYVRNIPESWARTYRL